METTRGRAVRIARTRWRFHRYMITHPALRGPRILGWVTLSFAALSCLLDSIDRDPGWDWYTWVVLILGLFTRWNLARISRKLRRAELRSLERDIWGA